MLCCICPLEEQGHLHQLPLQWYHLKVEAMENLMQGKCFVLKAKQNANLISFEIFLFFQGMFAFVLFRFVFVWLLKSHFQLVLIPANVNWEPLFEGSGRLLRVSLAVARRNTQEMCLLTCSSGIGKTQEWKMVFWVTIMLDQKEKIVGGWIWRKVGFWIVNPELAGAVVDGWCGKCKVLGKFGFIPLFPFLHSKNIKFKRLRSVKKILTSFFWKQNPAFGKYLNNSEKCLGLW